MHFHIGFVKNTEMGHWTSWPTGNSTAENEEREKAAMDNHAA